MKPTALLLVALGGSLGAVSRFAIATFASHRFSPHWPWGTFLINMTGCLVIGFFAAATSGRFQVADEWRWFFPIGFVGAYTTFSTYELETLRLVETGAWPRAVSYVLASTFVGFAAVFVGTWLGKRLFY
jgi:CrcB protein